MDSDYDALINALSGFGVTNNTAKTFASFQQVAEKSSPANENDPQMDMSQLDASSFDMSALMDACKEISNDHAVEEKVKQTNLFMKHILNVYEEVLEEGKDGKEHISETFLKKLKKSKKRENSFKQNRRQAHNKNRHDDYNEKMNQKLTKKRRNLKAKSRMSIY